MAGGCRTLVEEVMSEDLSGLDEAGPSQRAVEVGIALFTMVFGAIVIYGSLQVGINWGVEGPKAGFFPFYIGVIIVGGGAFNLVRVFTDVDRDRVFASFGQLRQVLSVVIPASIYVVLVPIIGIYVASLLLLAVFMRWLGGYRWDLVILIAVGVPAVFYLMFELWFLVPLPKGPIEDLLGL
jgi:putative tricarboxylic transport membrane protein